MENRIKMLREEQKMTQVRLSIELGVSQETVSAYELGRHYPSAQMLIKLTGLFHASIDYILGLSSVRLPVSAVCLPEDEASLLTAYRAMSASQREKATAYIAGLLDQN